VFRGLGTRMRCSSFADPARSRAVVPLRYHDDLPHRTFATIMAGAAGTVPQHTARALSSLARELPHRAFPEPRPPLIRQRMRRYENRPDFPYRLDDLTTRPAPLTCRPGAGPPRPGCGAATHPATVAGSGPAGGCRRGPGGPRPARAAARPRQTTAGSVPPPPSRDAHPERRRAFIPSRSRCANPASGHVQHRPAPGGGPPQLRDDTNDPLRPLVRLGILQAHKYIRSAGDVRVP